MLKTVIRYLSKTPFSIILKWVYIALIFLQYYCFRMKWLLSGCRKPTQEEIEDMCGNVTIIYKSFERQKMAKRLYKNIQSYYPGIRVVIADDSKKPLELKGENLQVLQLPFNSGLSYGLNRALEKVETPFVIRMDDDELLTPYTGFGRQLNFLREYPFVDLVGVLPLSPPKCEPPEQVAEMYYRQPMNDAPKRLKIPHMSRIDDRHVVVGKPANIYIARTERVREIGYDDHIRMLDHDEFFYRAAGNLISVLDHTAFVFHYHNRFDKEYQKYRENVEGDRRYIEQKKRLLACYFAQNRL